MLAGCFTPVKEAPPEDTGPDAKAVFAPEIKGNPGRLAGDDAASDLLAEVAGDDIQPDAVADSPADDDGEEHPAEVTATSDAGLPDDASPAGDATATDASADVGPVCGDGACNGSETCSDCPKDCGACPPVCNVLTSKGCDGGKQCFPDGKQNLCYAAGAGKSGEKCAKFNDCAVGSLCVAGGCRLLCDWTGKDAMLLCKPGVPCEKLIFEGAGEVGSNIGACKPGDNCNPLNDVGCPSGQTCAMAGWYKACVVAGSGGLGAACAGTGGCKAGLICVAEGGKSTCRVRCNTDGGAPFCSAGDCKPQLGPDGKAVPEFVGYCSL